VPKAPLLQLLAHVLDRLVAEGDDTNTSKIADDDVGDEVQDRLRLAGARWPLDHRQRVGQALSHRLSLAEVAGKRARDPLRCTAPLGKFAIEIQGQNAVGIDMLK
jgi:hypothetical protein